MACSQQQAVYVVDMAVPSMGRPLTRRAFTVVLASPHKAGSQVVNSWSKYVGYCITVHAMLGRGRTENMSSYCYAVRH